MRYCDHYCLSSIFANSIPEATCPISTKFYQRNEGLFKWSGQVTKKAAMVIYDTKALEIFSRTKLFRTCFREKVKFNFPVPLYGKNTELKVFKSFLRLLYGI